MRVTVDTPTTNIILEGERWYQSAAYPGGNAVSPSTYQIHSRAAAPAGVSTSWPAPGYSDIETTVQIGIIWHKVSFNVPGYRETFGMEIKSPRFFQTDLGYRFDPDQLILPHMPIVGTVT